MKVLSSLKLVVLTGVMLVGGLLAEAEAHDKLILEDIIVIGEEPERLYRVEKITSGKLPSTPLTSPLSITAISAELIRDQGARSELDLFRNVPGVNAVHAGGGYGRVSSRGFRHAETFYDGLRGDPNTRHRHIRLFDIERVEFLRGPAGMLYGQGSPGGIVNYITKTPTDYFFARAIGIGGTEGHGGASLDINAPLLFGLQGSAVRVGVHYENQYLPRNNAAQEDLMFFGVLSFDLGFGDLFLRATYYDQLLDGARIQGIPVDQFGNFLADRRWNANEPHSFQKSESTTLSARIVSEPFGSLSWDATVRFTDSSEDMEFYEARRLEDWDGDGKYDAVGREFRDQLRLSEQIAFGINAIWSAQFGNVENRMLFGYEFFDEEFIFHSARQRFGDVPGLSLLNPVYDADPTTYNLRVSDPRTRWWMRQGFYLIQEATLGQWIGVVGARYSEFKDEDTRRGGGEFSDNETTFSAGLVYRLRPDVSLFANWGESFEPQSIRRQAPEVGGPFRPTTGEVFDVGVRTDLFGGRLQSSATVYNIVKRDVLQPLGIDAAGDGTDDWANFGEVTSTGFEFEIIADITDNWLLMANYAYINARVTATNRRRRIGNSAGDNEVGDRMGNSPRNQAGFWTRYQVNTNLAVALGGDYVGERVDRDNYIIKSYMVFDASVSYDWGPFNLRLIADNLLDATYALAGSRSPTGSIPGEPRSVFLEVSREW